MAMQFYASPEQVQRDRSEYARKGIARGRSAVVLTYDGGVLLVAENLTSLRKISEIYDKIGFAAVGRYNEFENLRRAGVRMADLNGLRLRPPGRDRAGAGQRVHPDARRDLHRDAEAVRGGDLRRRRSARRRRRRAVPDHLRRFGAWTSPGFMAMGGQAEAIANVLRERHDVAADLADGAGAGRRGAGQRRRRERRTARRWARPSSRWPCWTGTRKGRAFRRIAGAALTALLEGGKDVPEKEVGEAGDAAPPGAGRGQADRVGRVGRPGGRRAARPNRADDDRRRRS